jgi:hypothetical protein
MRARMEMSAGERAPEELSSRHPHFRRCPWPVPVRQVTMGILDALKP